MNTIQAPNVGVGGINFDGKEIKNIRVIVECIKTGKKERDFDCGTDQKRADRLEDSLFELTNLDKYYVYQSVRV